MIGSVETPRGGSVGDRIIRRFEALVTGVLLLLLAMVLVLSTVEFAWVLLQDVASPPFLILEIDELLEIFGLFLLVLIGVELFEAIVKTFLHEQVDRAKVVMVVALIAVSRKVIVMDVSSTDPLIVGGVGVVILALSLGYLLLGRAAPMGPPPRADAGQGHRGSTAGRWGSGA